MFVFWSWGCCLFYFNLEIIVDLSTRWLTYQVKFIIINSFGFTIGCCDESTIFPQVCYGNVFVTYLATHTEWNKP